MRTGPPALLPILRSQVQGELLALLYLHPEVEYSLTEAARQLGVSVKAVHHEASRLVLAGLVKDARRGNVRLLRAETNTPLYRPLSDLLSLTYGPEPVLSELIGRLSGIDAAYIYGSWAARYQGEQGPPPNDVDVMIVGDVDANEIFRISEQAEARLLRPVNIQRVRPAVWRDRSSRFAEAVRSGPLVELKLEAGSHAA
jgi:DNA-binding transcriptional ArsR family regulator